MHFNLPQSIIIDSDDVAMIVQESDLQPAMVSPVPEGFWSSRIPMSQPTQALEEELKQKMEKVKASWKKF